MSMSMYTHTRARARARTHTSHLRQRIWRMLIYTEARSRPNMMLSVITSDLSETSPENQATDSADCGVYSL